MSAEQLPADYDPAESDRSWVRNSTTGDLGYLVRRNGRSVVKLDRPMQEILRTHNGDWQPEEAHRPLADAHSARVAFEADKALCAALGDHSRSRKAWSDLSDVERGVWSGKGPSGLLRSALFQAVRGAMAPHVRK